MSAWTLTGLRKTYRQGSRQVTALAGVDLTLDEHELLVVLGQAGAGKSTLLRLIAGLEKPDSGAVLRDGKDITAWPPDGRDIAMVFQNFSLYPHLTVRDNLAFPLRPGRGVLDKSEIENRIRQTAEMLSIGPLLERLPGRLSGGELQRVAIGRCLVRRPSLFLFDEPLVNLDAKLRETLRSELHRIQRETGIAMIYVTHDQGEAMTLADRLVVMDAGQVLQVGKPEWVYAKPQHSRVARLLGMPPINLFTPQQAQSLGLPVAAGVCAGLRPECLELIADPSGMAQVVATERLGHAEIVVVEMQGRLLRAYFHGNSGYARGEKVRLRADAKDVIWFPA